MSGWRRGGCRKAALLGLALVVFAAIAQGCGRRAPERPQQSTTPDSLQSLATEVERRFVEADEDTTPERRSREEATQAVRALAMAVISSTRSGSSTPGDLEAALRSRGLSVQAREIVHGKEPWLLLVADSRRPDVPAVALLVYPRSRGSVSLDDEPFQHSFQVAAWTDSAGQAMLVAGVRRSPAGPQPTAWLFRLAAKPPPAAEMSPAIAPSGMWGLAAAGPGEVTFRSTRADSPPIVTVRRSALPNPLFEECISCPHVEADIVYHFDGTTLVLEKRVVRRTPYAAFVGFVEALVAHDQTAAMGLASSHDILQTALDLKFDRMPESGRWRIAPGISASSLEQVYLRGQEGAFRVQLAPADTGFIITSISKTDYSLE